MNGIFNSTTIPVLQEVVSFAQARHNVLAGNIANLDTPGYRVRDLSLETFQEHLADAVEAQKNDDQYISPGEISRSGDAAMQGVRESMTNILYHDDSNVGVEQQVLEVSKNQYLHNMAISIMSSQFRMLQTAISERV